MVTAGILPFRENSHGRAGNRTRDLMISSQRLRPLDHEAGLFVNVVGTNKIRSSLYIHCDVKNTVHFPFLTNKVLMNFSKLITHSLGKKGQHYY